MDVTLEIMSNRQILIGLSLSAQYQKLICIAVLVLLVSLKILYKFPTFPLGEGFLDFFINVKKEKKRMTVVPLRTESPNWHAFSTSVLSDISIVSFTLALILNLSLVRNIRFKSQRDFKKKFAVPERPVVRSLKKAEDSLQSGRL
ncbi:uncharacterized protein EV154DRAFT_476369 [Mucor mucedo]|uniref:uncharacterized protein n=1 Tax=Mucor mucedo TaxID=29922 RepID=UPI00221ECB2D|nr:uncharacterized protein EV154DRAFT_476369 [Mucor mucedo]KAI7896353.1 hypothetical protein EV154DRAFT_476369 [Mucor mucedo]